MLHTCPTYTMDSIPYSILNNALYSILHIAHCVHTILLDMLYTLHFQFCIVILYPYHAVQHSGTL